jgi:hypothetical protein
MFNKTYQEILADHAIDVQRDYAEWLAREPEREAARKAAAVAYYARLDARETRLKALVASAITAEQAMTQLSTAYLADDSDYDQDFVEEFRAVLQAWENGQKAVR